MYIWLSYKVLLKLYALNVKLSEIYLNRLLCHLKPKKGILFLMLPKRCINSVYLGRKQFEDLLNGLGCSFSLPVHETPRIIFYTLSLMNEKDDSQEGLSTICYDWRIDTQERLQRNMNEETKKFFSTKNKLPIGDGNSSSFSLIISDQLLKL